MRNQLAPNIQRALENLLMLVDNCPNTGPGGDSMREAQHMGLIRAMEHYIIQELMDDLVEHEEDV